MFCTTCRVENLLQGCSDHLPIGGHLLICGPFFNNGEAADSLLIYDAALRDFAATSERKLHWGCHDVMQIVASGSKVGFSLVAHEETDGVGGHSWILIVLRRERIERRGLEGDPGSGRRQNSASDFWTSHSITAVMAELRPL